MSSAMLSKRRKPCGLPCLLLACGLMFSCTSVAGAAVLVEGTRADLRVVSESESIAGVLSAVSATLNVKVRSTISLETPSSKVYRGSFNDVISQLLSGYNYVIRHENETEIIVLGKRGEAPVTSEPKQIQPKGIVSRWR